MKSNRAMRRIVAVAAIAGAAVLILALGLPAPALATHWTEVPFPARSNVQDVVEDSAGNIWATMYAAYETGGNGVGNVVVLRNGASSWEDGSAGITEDWVVPMGSLLCVGDKLFLNTEDVGCYARSVDDASWHLVSADAEPLVFHMVEWAGYVWAAGGDEMWRLDPETETWKTVNAGLPIMEDSLEDTYGFWQPWGNADYLYVGSTVQGAEASKSDFPGVGVYRLRRGSGTWEDTGLRVQPLETDFQLAGWETAEWGVWSVIAGEGYVLCQIDDTLTEETQSPDRYYRLFFFDEQGGTWTPVETPPEAGRHSLYHEQNDCYAWDGEFWFPMGSTGDAAQFDVFDPVSQSWRTGVTKPAIPWGAIAYGVYLVGDELLTDASTGPSTPTEPGFVASVPLPTEISKDPEVIGTNFVLALLFAAIFGFTSTLFNNTLKSKNAEIVATFGPVTRALKTGGRSAVTYLRRLGGRLKAAIPWPAWLRRQTSRVPHLSRRWVEPIVIVVVTGLIYAFLDPGFGFSTHGLLIFVSLAVSVAVVTYAYEGVQALASSRRYQVPAGVKLFPAAIAIAVICVIVSRVSGFTPGYLYGFVGGLAFLGVQEPDDRKKGRLVLVAAGCLLVVSLATWFLTIPLTNAVDAGSSWLTVVQGICVATFVAGLEGLVFGLVPLSFMDGATLFRWNKWVWGAVFGVAVFLFWHVLLNKNSKYGAAFQQTSAKVVIGLLAFWTVVTVGTYLYFRKPWVKTVDGDSDALWQGLGRLDSERR